jgi:hypothetical protein
MPDSLHAIPSFIKINKDGQGYNPHVHTGSDVNGYVHTAGGGKCLYSQDHTAGSVVDTSFKSTLQAVGRSIPTGPMYFLSSVFGSFLSSLTLC